jgi:hypothetical protein
MQMHYIYCGFVVVLNLLITEIVFAFEAAVEFSATAVQIAPGQPEYQKTMYVGKDIVRTDSVLGNNTLVEIVNSKERVRLFLIPGEKIYLQQESTGPVMPVVSGDPGSTSPCSGINDTSCEMLGKEMINNRLAEKWEFTENQGSQMHLSLHWIDVERRMVVREFIPDGTLTELLPLGTEQIHGRQTEKWLWRTLTPDGQMETATQWYDPELKMAIREELPGGYIRELRDIKIGAQEKTLFEIPEGYKQVESLQGYDAPQQPIISAEQR